MFTAEQAAAVASSFEKNVPFLQRRILGSPGHVYGVQAAASICFCLADMLFFETCVYVKKIYGIRQYLTILVHTLLILGSQNPTYG